jgi:hypothetical protein
MVKTNWAIDLEAQHISRLNEHILMVDRIRKACLNVRQGNGLLPNKLFNLNGNSGSVTTLLPLLSFGGLVFVDRFASLSAQNDRDFRPVAGPLSPKSLPLWDPQHRSIMFSASTTFRAPMLQL